ncbi:MAG: ABC transporter substrate-binding protein, partial [Maricaulis sp.]|nr:ABC transporter substrate-binding protein [Maricaulis sp.]
MDRRTFISGGAVAAATVATACGETGQENAAGPAAPAVNRGVKRLRMVTTWPANFPGLGTAANNVAAYINRMSGGSLDVRVYAAGEIVSAFEAFDAVSEGTADMYHGAEYY